MATISTHLVGGISLHMQDLADEVRRIDELIFTSHQRPLAPVLSYDEYPDGAIPGLRVCLIASFRKCCPQHSCDSKNVSALRASHECYALWQSGIARKLGSASFRGFGDAHINHFWFLAAVALVRGRVLSHPTWFRKPPLRTPRSVAKKYSGIFGDNIFAAVHKMKELISGDGMTEREKDMLLTQFLADTLMEEGERIDDQALVELITIS